MHMVGTQLWNGMELSSAVLLYSEWKSHECNHGYLHKCNFWKLLLDRGHNGKQHRWVSCHPLAAEAD